MKINKCVKHFLQQNTDYFGEIGCLKEKYHILVHREIPPVINLPRYILAL